MLENETLPGWLGPKKPNVEGTDDTQTYGKHLPFCSDAEGGASGNPPEPMGMQVPAGPNRRSQRGPAREGVVCSGSGYPCSPNTLKGCKQGRPGTAEVILAGALPSIIFILAVWGWGSD